jgi:hypothetical protein
MATRDQLILELRRRLYTLPEPDISKVARQMEIKIDGFTSEEQLGTIERKIELSVKDADYGVKFLQAVLDDVRKMKSLIEITL